MILAEAMDVPTWIGVPTGVAGLGIPLYLWLSKKVVLRSDHDSALDAQREKYEGQLAVERQRLADRDDRLAHVIADRDAWRAAHVEEAKALADAQRATTMLMDTSDISRSLLQALRDALGERRGS